MQNKTGIKRFGDDKPYDSNATVASSQILTNGHL